MNKTILSAAALFSLSTSSFAGPSDDASAHFKAIASGNIDQIMQTYADTAALHWVGGPLDGVYAGSDRIRETWSNFAKNAPFEVSVARLEEASNPKGATVTANVEFKGKTNVKVRYVLVYRDGKLMNEVWQIDPRLSTGN